MVHSPPSAAGPLPGTVFRKVKRTVRIRVVHRDSPSLGARAWAEALVVVVLALFGFFFFALFILTFLKYEPLELLHREGPVLFLAAALAAGYFSIVFSSGAFGYRLPRLMLRPDTDPKTLWASWIFYFPSSRTFMRLWGGDTPSKFAALLMVDRRASEYEARAIAENLMHKEDAQPVLERLGEVTMSKAPFILWLATMYVVVIMVVNSLVQFEPPMAVAGAALVVISVVFFFSGFGLTLDSMTRTTKHIARYTRALRELEGFD